MTAPTQRTERFRWTQQDLVAEARERFGHEPKDWAFVCPNCGDVATARAFYEAGADPYRIGRECIGRHLGALAGAKPTQDSGRALAERGCDWAAYGLFCGPWFITMPSGLEVASFALAMPGRQATM